MSLPWGFHVEYPDGGMDRPHDVCWNDAEVELCFDDHTRPTITCGYCSNKIQTRSPEKARDWWRAHDCPSLEAAEAHTIVADLSPLLRAA